MENPMLTFLIANFVAIVGVGVGLATLILKQGARLDRSIERSEARTGKRIDETNQRIDETNKRLDRLEHRHGELRERMAKLEGLLEGLREAIAGRRAA